MPYAAEAQIPEISTDTDGHIPCMILASESFRERPPGDDSEWKISKDRHVGISGIVDIDHNRRRHAPTVIDLQASGLLSSDEMNESKVIVDDPVRFTIHKDDQRGGEGWEYVYPAQKTQVAKHLMPLRDEAIGYTIDAIHDTHFYRLAQHGIMDEGLDGRSWLRWHGFFYNIPQREEPLVTLPDKSDVEVVALGTTRRQSEVQGKRTTIYELRLVLAGRFSEGWFVGSEFQVEINCGWHTWVDDDELIDASVTVDGFVDVVGEDGQVDVEALETKRVQFRVPFEGNPHIPYNFSEIKLISQDIEEW
ncbi:MAG: hypothetical protein AAGH92_13275 [Planctomycetota bacterium]